MELHFRSSTVVVSVHPVCLALDQRRSAQQPMFSTPQAILTKVELELVYHVETICQIVWFHCCLD